MLARKQVGGTPQRSFPTMYLVVKLLIPLLVIAGPTATGKTAMAVELSRRIGGEVVSADSMQVYRFMDIGTAKPTLEERRGIPHHMIDIIHPTADFSVAEYARLAHEAVEDIHNRGKLPVLAGGTGLYINTVIDNVVLGEGSSDLELRERLAKEEAEHGTGWLHGRLKEIDPPAYERLHPNDTRRIIRALEVYYITGETITEAAAKSKLMPSRYKMIYIGLENERQILYKRIDARVDRMLEDGLVDEAQGLVKMGCNRNHTSMQAIGYKEILNYMDGLCGLDEAADAIRQGTRNYAKRQFTWFRRDKRIKWFDTLQPGVAGECERYIFQEGFGQ